MIIKAIEAKIFLMVGFGIKFLVFGPQKILNFTFSDWLNGCTG